VAAAEEAIDVRLDAVEVRLVDSYTIEAYERKNLGHWGPNRSHLNARQTSETYIPTYIPMRVKRRK
jgi:hypothetical protein